MIACSMISDSPMAYCHTLNDMHAKPVEDLIDVEEVNADVIGLHQSAPLHSIGRLARQCIAEQNQTYVACMSS